MQKFIKKIIIKKKKKLKFKTNFDYEKNSKFIFKFIIFKFF